VLFAPPGHALAGTLRERLPSTVLTHAAAGSALPAQRHALALVADTLETLPPADGRALLAALRDRGAAHVLVLADLARSRVPEAELRALGFRAHARDGDAALFGFDLYGYKDRPDWLGPQHWAHPELWDRFRW